LFGISSWLQGIELGYGIKNAILIKCNILIIKRVDLINLGVSRTWLLQAVIERQLLADSVEKVTLRFLPTKERCLR